MVLLGMKYAKGPDGTRGFGLGRGRPLPQGLPAPLPRQQVPNLAEEGLGEGLPPPGASWQPSGSGQAALAFAEPHAHGAKSWATIAGNTSSDSLVEQGVDNPDDIAPMNGGAQLSQGLAAPVSSCDSISPLDALGTPPGLSSLTSGPAGGVHEAGSTACGSHFAEMWGNVSTEAAAATSEEVQRPPTHACAHWHSVPDSTATLSREHQTPAHGVAVLADAEVGSGALPHSPSTSLKAMLGIRGGPPGSAPSDGAVALADGANVGSSSEMPRSFLAEQAFGSPATEAAASGRGQTPNSGLGGSRLGGWCTSSNGEPEPQCLYPDQHAMDAFLSRANYSGEEDPLAGLKGLSQLHLDQVWPITLPGFSGGRDVRSRSIAMPICAHSPASC